MNHVDTFINGPLQFDPSVKLFILNGKCNFQEYYYSFAAKKRQKIFFINFFPSKSLPEAIKSMIC